MITGNKVEFTEFACHVRDICITKNNEFALFALTDATIAIVNLIGNPE